MTDRKAEIISVDMSDEMQQEDVHCAKKALEKYKNDQDVAAYIKKEFDKKYYPIWHCVVGHSFSLFVTHGMRCFIYFTLGNVTIVLFKSG